MIAQRRRVHADARDLARDPRPTTAAARRGLADGIVITPSHNPPEDGGFKYNPPNGGPADTRRHRLDRGRRPTRCWRDELDGVQRMPLRAGAQRRHDARATTSSTPTSTTSATSSTWTRSAAPACASASIRSAAPACTTGRAIAERYRLDLDGRQRRGRSDVPLHDARLGRQDPHGSARRRTRCSG